MRAKKLLATRTISVLLSQMCGVLSCFSMMPKEIVDFGEVKEDETVADTIACVRLFRFVRLSLIFEAELFCFLNNFSTPRAAERKYK